MARSRARARRRVVSWQEVVLVAVSLLIAVAVGAQLGDPARATFVARNDTRWDLALEVQHDGASMPLSTIGHGRSKELAEVPVPGDTWQLVWRFEGREIGRSVVDDDDLQRAGFELRAPADVEAALRAADAAPSP